MSKLVPWNGVELDIDVSELTGWELSQIKQRTGYSYAQLLAGLKEFDGDATRVIFWIAEKRHRPDLKFDGYHGPTLAFFSQYMGNLTPEGDESDAVGGEDEAGKVPAAAAILSIEMPGSPPSPPASDGPAPSTTT